MNIRLVTATGKEVSIAFGNSAYCEPREDNAAYTQVEIGLWHRPDSALGLDEYAEWASPNQLDSELRVFAYVPVSLLPALLQS